MNWQDLYLKRLSLSAWPALDAVGLAKLHRAHVEAIPFGNLDLLLGDKPELTHDAIVNKLLVRNRPGYCFEINTLLAGLLVELGLQPTFHMARVLLENAMLHERPRSHLLITLKLDGDIYLLDAGFGGGGICEPIPLRTGEIFDQGVDQYRLLQDEAAAGWYLQRNIKGEWSNMYWFDLTPAFPADAQIANHYAATAPDSRFLRDLMVTRMQGAQRLIMHNGRLNKRSAASNELETFSDTLSFKRLMLENFGVELQPDQAEQISLFAFPV
jgi:N-hydroxyarylamine O-acetyltransferase